MDGERYRGNGFTVLGITQQKGEVRHTGRRKLVVSICVLCFLFFPVLEPILSLNGFRMDGWMDGVKKRQVCKVGENLGRGW